MLFLIDSQRHEAVFHAGIIKIQKHNYGCERTARAFHLQAVFSGLFLAPMYNKRVGSNLGSENSKESCEEEGNQDVLQYGTAGAPVSQP